MVLTLKEISQKLHRAQVTAQETDQLEEELTVEQAYQVQKMTLSARTQNGETYIGPKLGFTSKAKMEQMGVDEIIVGFLTDAMDHSPEEPLSLHGLIHPRIEPELVFELSREVVADPDETVESLAEKLENAVARVAVGMEVIDSRYRDFKFNLADVVADNTSAAKFIVGDAQPYPRDLEGLGVEFLIDGITVDTADTNAILGHPKEAFTELAKMILKYGFEIPAGATILAGSMTAAQWLKPGQTVEARVESFEPLTITVTD